MRVILSLFCLFSLVLGEKMEIFVIINEQKLKAVLAENSRALALYKELEKGDIIINASDYGGFEKAANYHRRCHEMMSKSQCSLVI